MSLAHVLWLGGSACAGKTSVARLLAARYGLGVYHVDDHFEDHRVRVDPVRHPCFARIKDLSPEELWMRPVGLQVEELLGFYREEFEMIVEDVSALPRTTAVLVEGAGLLPDLVGGALAQWLVATPELRRRLYPDRGSWVRELLSRCRDPEEAYRNWMERDDRFADAITDSVRRHGGRPKVVDGRRTLEEVASAVARLFGLEAARSGP